MAYNDWTLLERWTRERDAEAFAEVARRYAGVVYGACRRVLGDTTEAEDAAQECFLTLAQTRKPPRTNLGAWLHRVAANKARDRVKAASRRRDRERRYVEHQPGATEIAWPEIESLVDDAIAALPEDTRDALVAHFMLGESHAAIAERLGVSRQTVTYRVGKGVEGIRDALRAKGIQVGATALTASLTAHMAEAAPAQLIAAVGKMAVSGVPAAAGGALSSAIISKAAFVGVPLLAVVLGIVALNQFDSPTGVENPTSGDTAPITSIVVEPAPMGSEAAPVNPDPSRPRESRAENARSDGPILSGAARDVSGAARFEVHSSESGAELEPIDIQLPEPYFGGTPLDYFSENLEERSFKPRPPFMAPKGAANLAKGKTVTSSDPDPNHGKLAFLTDGKKGYQQECLVELASGVQWVQIDLGQVSEIYAIVVWHFHAADRVYFDVAVRVADDAEFTKNVQTIFNNDHDNSSRLGVGKDKEYIETYEGRLMDAKGIKGRYVRLYSNGNTTDETNHYVEVEVYGKPVTSTVAEPAQDQPAASQPPEQGAAPNDPGANTDLAPIAVELPPPYFGGTPLEYYSDILEERSFKPRPPFMAPKGIFNLAKGKAVTSSDPDPNYGKLAFLTDGEKGYQQDYLVELANGVQWAQLDLGQVSEIYALVLWHFHAGDRVYFDVVVRVADDAEFTKNVQTIYNNDHDNSSGLGVGKDKEYVENYEGRLMDAKGIKGRYVRLYSNGNTTDETNHYVEVEVFGKPAMME